MKNLLQNERKRRKHKSHTESNSKPSIPFFADMFVCASAFFRYFLSSHSIVTHFRRTGTMFNCHNSSSLKYDKIRWFFEFELMRVGCKFPLIDYGLTFSVFLLLNSCCFFVFFFSLWFLECSTAIVAASIDFVSRLQSKRLNLKRFYWHTWSSKYLRLVKSDCILHFYCASSQFLFHTSSLHLIILFVFVPVPVVFSRWLRYLGRQQKGR